MEVACFKWLGRLSQANGPEYKRLLLRSSVCGLGTDRQLEVAVLNNDACHTPSRKECLRLGGRAP